MEIELEMAMQISWAMTIQMSLEMATGITEEMDMSMGMAMHVSMEMTIVMSMETAMEITETTETSMAMPMEATEAIQEGMGTEMAIEIEYGASSLTCRELVIQLVSGDLCCSVKCIPKTVKYLIYAYPYQ